MDKYLLTYRRVVTADSEAEAVALGDDPERNALWDKQVQKLVVVDGSWITEGQAKLRRASRQLRRLRK